jgi:hypothetical protein
VGRQDLDGHVAVELNVPREVDDAHSTTAELALNRVFASEGRLEVEKLGSGLRHSRYYDRGQETFPLRRNFGGMFAYIWGTRRSAMEETLVFAQVMTVVVMSTAAFVGIALGARVLWRKGSAVKPRHVAPYDEQRQERLETAVDAIAIEVERISEAQRFMVGLLSQPIVAQRSERGELPSAERSGRVITPH